MVLLFVLMTLVVLAVSINVSEKVFYPRRDIRVTNKSVYENTTHFCKDKNKYYRFLKSNAFRLVRIMNSLQNKLKKRNTRIENEEKYEKKNNNVIPWPKE